jgi:hypothetical protein
MGKKNKLQNYFTTGKINEGFDWRGSNETKGSGLEIF